MKHKFKYNSLNELPISKFAEFSNKFSIMDNIEAELYALSLLLDISLDEVYAMSTSDAQQYIAQMHDKLLKRNNSSKHPKHLTINGRKYNINYNINKMNMAQYVDFQLYMINATKDPSNIMNMVDILTVFAIPEDHNYGENYDVMTVKDDLSTLQINVVQSIIFFLKKRSIRSIRNRLSYLQTTLKVTKILTKDKETRKQIQDTIESMKQTIRILD